MEDINRLADSINELTNALLQPQGIDWASAISAACAVISLIAIIVLLKERSEKKRPYLQVSFELVRSSLVCLVIRNVGEIPAILKEIKFNPSFVKQMPERVQKRAQDKTGLSISIHPKQQWVYCFDTITSEVAQFENAKLEVSFAYTAKDKKNKSFYDTEIVNFNDYSGFLVYISETDELKEEVKKLTKSVNTITQLFNKLINRKPSETQTEAYRDLLDAYTRVIVTRNKENKIIEEGEDTTNA